MRKSLIIFLAFAAILHWYNDYSVKNRAIYIEKIKFYQEIVDSETEWIKEQQLSNGALGFRVENGKPVWVNPYFSDYSALALIQCGDDKEYQSDVRQYLEWHFDHLNDAEVDINGIDGTIYEYEVELKNGTIANEISKNEYDSVDSYSASFINLLWKYYEHTEDGKYLLTRYNDIQRVVRALFFTIDDGLSITKPNYQVKYLMDNSEVYEGIAGAAKLYEKVFLPGLADNQSEYEKAQLVRDSLEEVLKKIEIQIEDKLWNSDENHYEIGIMVNGKTIENFCWEKFYPDATSQLFPILHGVIDKKSSRAECLYEKFNENHKWQDFEHFKKGEAQFYWGRIPYVGAMMRDEGKVYSYMEYYKENIMIDHKKPLYNADAAWVALAADKMIEYYETKMSYLLP